MVMTKTVLVTGANRGIGLSFCRHYQARGWNVYGVCRNTSDALDALQINVVSGIDVSDPESITQLKQQLEGIPLDILINNAGILRNERLGSLNFSDMQQQFEVNTLGPLRVTEALMGNLSEGSKVALITSRMGSITDNTSGGYYGYRMSKAALNSAGVSLARDLAPKGIAVAILHPGLVGTEMIGGVGDLTPDEAAQRLIARIDELSLQNSGSFRHSNGDSLPW
ncbi:oxidoreductase, short chain dehydrogenase/reductase family [Oleiphilus messinensis]|uniref:Oxidoreductase, short chain dehydrogenase/reductase family n=2 Tax=Oleiphilus messinensis TaxID=141451 RepID=A0A1Y0IER2_9GAMM|nr:oxidoreductase, short chain dehydrogenase/reductase family [Oleiphilus messinensis]